MTDPNLAQDAVEVAPTVQAETADSRFGDDAIERDLAYWRGQLAGTPAILELPTDRPRPPAQTFRAAREQVFLSESLRDGLEELSAREGVSLFVVLLAAFQTLLMRYTRQDDIVVGSVMPSEVEADTAEEFAGCSVSTVPIRTDLSGDISFRQLLRRVSVVVRGARQHESVPWQRVVDAVQPVRDSSHHPVFQTLFSLEDSEFPSESDFGIADVAEGAGTLKVDLQMMLCNRADGLAAHFSYATDLFDATTIVRMAGHFQKLLEGIVANPNGTIAGLPLLTDAERHELVIEWNDTRRDYARELCVHQAFEAQAARTPNAVAVVFENEQITYAELNRRANQLSHYLVRLGVGANVLVGICVERSIEMVVGLLGILKAGGAYVPVDPAFPRDRIAFMLGDAEAPVLLTQESLVGILPQTKATLVRLDADWPITAAAGSDNLPSRAAAQDLAYTIYTSGSTGKPKGVQIPHFAVVNFLESMAEKPGMTAQDRMLAVTTLSFDIAGLEIYLPLILGASVEIVSRSVYSDGNHLLAKLLSSGATVMQATPATWRMLLEAGWQSSPGLKILVGGEAVPGKLANQLMQRAASVWNMYGPTETTIWSTVRKFEPGEACVSIGRPIANTEIFILDKVLQPVPVGVAGELLIGGDGLAKGYFKRPELTAEKFIAHPLKPDPKARLYKTGDLARYLPNGNIEFLGRIDHQVKIRGFRIELGEIESVLRQHHGIHETVVVAQEDVAGDKRVVAYFVPTQAAAPTVAELRAFLKEKLPEYMLPSIFVSLERMPLTPNGKVDRRALPAPEQSAIPAADEFVAPRDEIESKLLQIWENLLSVRPIGVRHDFFELGGHSLLAARLMAQIGREFHINVPIATLFQARTVEQLASIIRDRGWKPTWSSLIAIQTKGSRSPFFCVHGIGGNVLGFYELSTHLGSTQPFYGLQAQGLDGAIAPHTRVEDMAAHYVEEIRKLQPHGPYFLGGLSFGGAIALEMAQQLRGQGQQVGLLALFDTYAGKSKSKSSLLLKFLRLPMQRKTMYVTQKTRSTVHGIWRWFYRLSLPRVLRNVRAAHQVAHSRYVMRRYDGAVTLFVPFDPSLRSSEDPKADWQEYAPHVEVEEIPGDHLTLLDEPHVGVLAQRLALCLEKAQGQPSARGTGAA
jgi:amino acid adenylation domain-containing protein